MRRPPRPLRAEPRPNISGARQQATPAGMPGAASAGKRALGASGGASLTFLVILFWLIFYQNLPSGFGLNVPDIPQAFATVTNTNEEGSSGNTVDRIIKICTILTSLYVVVRRWPLTRSLSKDFNFGAAALLALVPLSAMWSISRSDTILRFISLASIALVCFAIPLAGWHRQRFQQLTLPPLMFILLTSLLLGVIYPDDIMEIGDDLSLKGAWHGITLTKNQFGMTASLAVIICANRWLAREGRTWWAFAGTITAVTCLILSRSNTSLFATLLAVMSMVMIMRVPVIKQRYTTHVVIAIAATLLIYEMVIQDVMPGAYTLLAPIRTLTGKDATFSARTVIWDIVKDHIQYAPYLGSGYGAYWIGPVVASPSFVFTYKMYFYPTEAHNGYLDIVNDLGYVGLVCVVILLIVYLRQALQLMKFDRPQAAMYLGVLFQQMVMNMSESEWLSRDSIATIFLFAIACMARSLREARLQAQASTIVRR